MKNDNKINYTSLSDEELAILAQSKDTEAMEVLIERYKKTVNGIARKFYLIGGDTEDLSQIGLIAVFKAIESFNGNYPFGAYVRTCIKNAVLSAVKSSNREKNKPLNDYVSISGINDEASDKNPVNVCATLDPEEKYIISESEKEFYESIRKLLSRFEYQIFTLYMDGYSYEAISRFIGKDIKSVDNAVQRIRRKIERTSEK